MGYGTSITVDAAFPEVVERTRQALADQGFGIVTEIDMQAVLKAKLDADIEPYVIWGACAPAYALRAIEAEPSIGLLLPCNVVIRSSGGQVVIEAIDPATMVELTGNPQMAGIATEVGQRLDAALTTLRDHA